MQTVCPLFGNNQRSSVLRHAAAMTLNTDMLAAFVQVAEQLSVSAAADRLGLGKSLVSKRIAQLEGVLKVTLFSRSTRRVALTPAGEAYLEFARRALLDVSAGEERLRDLRLALSGQIRLTAPVSWGQRVLAKRLPGFLHAHPGVEIELQLADRIMDVAFERMDLALRWSDVTPTAGLSAFALARIGWVLAAAPAYLQANGTPEQPQDLSTHNCLGYWRESSDDAWTLCAQTNPQQQPEQVKVRSRYHANNAEAVAEAALAGLGIALLPDYLCDDALADGRLTHVLPTWTPRTKYGAGITAVAPPERMRLARNTALLEYLRLQLA
jgi:DNA-binding transcriptional LysR family regulator